ncbi:MAG: hypothetical protein ACRD18_13035, partial [Terriglobia bacterium]
PSAATKGNVMLSAAKHLFVNHGISRFFAALRMTARGNLAKKTRFHDLAMQSFAFQTLRFSIGQEHGQT